MRGVERLEAFSDGVYAIAITLLIIEIKVPAPDAVAAGGLWHALGAHWSSYAAFTLSFLIVGIMWANHHNIFRYISHANHTLVMLNLGLMLCTAFLPFPTAVLAAYLPSHEGPALRFTRCWRCSTLFRITRDDSLASNRMGAFTTPINSRMIFDHRAVLRGFQK